MAHVDPHTACPSNECTQTSTASTFAFLVVGGTSAVLAAAAFATACGGGGQGNARSETGDSSADATPDTRDEASPSTRDATAADVGKGGDAGISSPAPPADWSTQEATAMCQGILNCCPGGLDSGTYDLAQCEAAFGTEGWFEYTLPSRSDLYASGHMVFEPDAGGECLNLLRHFQCGTKTPAYWQSITSVCFAALRGNIPTGSAGCRSSWECSPGNFCDTTADGGLCSPLVGRGEPCGTKARADEMCSYLGSDTPALWCNVLDGGSTCQPLMAHGAACTDPSMHSFYDMGCSAGLCGDDGLCGDPTATPFPSFCQLYAFQDGGD